MIVDLMNLSIASASIALVVLALVVALFKLNIRPVRWVLSLSAIVSLVIAIGVEVEAIWEIWTFGLPLTLPEAPFGTYEHPTVLMLLGLIVPFLFILVGAVLAFRRPGLAGLFFLAYVASAVPTFVSGLAGGFQENPTGGGGQPFTFVDWLIVMLLPAIAMAARLLAVWWARRGTPQSRSSMPAPA